jgi:uncharacterized repeat protein (TIGR02543 family)
MDILWKNAYESETFALNQGYAASPFKTIDRQSGAGTFERPIATHTQTYTTVGVGRDWLPDEFGLMWYTNNHSRTGLYVPIYVSTKRVDMPDSWWNFPAEFGTEENPIIYQFKYNADSTWWQFQMLKTFCNLRYKDMLSDIRNGYSSSVYSAKGFTAIETEDRNRVATVEAAALALSGQARIDYLSAYTGERCKNADTAVRDMLAHLIRYFRNAGGTTAAPALTANYVRPGGPLWSTLWANETTAGRIAGTPLANSYNDAGVDNLGYYFYVTFDPDGGAFVLPANYPNKYAVKKDGTYVKRVGMYNHGVALPPAPVQAGLSFAGWFDAKTGGTEYKGKTDLSGSLYLYARWEAAPAPELQPLDYLLETEDDIQVEEVITAIQLDEGQILADEWKITIDEDETGNDSEKGCSAFAAGKYATVASPASGGRAGYTVNAYTCDGSSNDLRLTIREPRPLVKGESYYRINYIGTSGNQHNIVYNLPVPNFVIDGFGNTPAKTHTNKWFKTEVPIANEKQVYFNENTDGSTAALSNSTSANCYTDWHTLLGITLEWADTAYDAVTVMGYLIENYGLRGSAESFVVSDPNECWVFEIPGNSTMWVAARIPDDGACYRANRLRIQDIDFDDPDNFRYSVNATGQSTLVERAHAVMRAGTTTPYYDPDLNGPFNFAKIFSSGHTTSSNVDREYPAHKLLCPSVDWRLNCISFPLWVIPEAKISPEWVMDTLWKHANEGTLLDRTIGYQHGPFKSPDRQSGYGSGPYHISTDTQAYTSVGVGRNWVPFELGMTWFSWSSSRASLYVPMYVSTKLEDMPKSWYDLAGFGTEENPILYQWKYDPNSSFWHFQFLKSLCNVRYSDMIADVRNGFSSSVYSVKGFAQIEAEDRNRVATMDAAALALSGQARIDYLSAYTGERCRNADQAVKDMIAHLITRFRNGAPSVASNFNSLTVYGGAVSPTNPTWSSLFAAENPANYFNLRDEVYVKDTLGYYYDVKFDPTGGVFADSMTGAYPVNNGILLKKVAMFNNGVAQPPAPSRPGYRFDGWFTAAAGGAKWDFAAQLTADLQLFAHWTQYDYIVYLKADKTTIPAGEPLLVDVMLVGIRNYTQLAAEIAYDTDLLEFDGYLNLSGWAASVTNPVANKVAVRSVPGMNMVVGAPCLDDVTIVTLKFKVKDGFAGNSISTNLSFASALVSPAGGVTGTLVEPSRPLSFTLQK